MTPNLLLYSLQFQACFAALQPASREGADDTPSLLLYKFIAYNSRLVLQLCNLQMGGG